MRCRQLRGSYYFQRSSGFETDAWRIHNGCPTSAEIESLLPRQMERRAGVCLREHCDPGGVVPVDHNVTRTPMTPGWKGEQDDQRIDEGSKLRDENQIKQQPASNRPTAKLRKEVRIPSTMPRNVTDTPAGCFVSATMWSMRWRVRPGPRRAGARRHRWRDGSGGDRPQSAPRSVKTGNHVEPRRSAVRS